MPVVNVSRCPDGEFADRAGPSDGGVAGEDRLAARATVSSSFNQVVHISLNSRCTLFREPSLHAVRQTIRNISHKLVSKSLELDRLGEQLQGKLNLGPSGSGAV